MRKLAIGCLVLASLIAAPSAGAMDFKVRTDQGEKCDVTTISEPTEYGLVVENCTTKVTSVRGFGELYSGGTLIDEHSFGPSPLPYAVMMRYSPPDEDTPQEGDRTRIGFQLRLPRGGKDPQTWKRTKDRRCFVLRGARPRDTLRCKVSEPTG